MKGFIKQLVTNRLGIILATLNLCYFVSPKFSANAFLTSLDNLQCFTKGSNFFVSSIYYIENLMLNANFPALGLSAISKYFIKLILWNPNEIAAGVLGFFSTLFFITLQWLFIGWTAKKIAFAIRPNLD